MTQPIAKYKGEYITCYPGSNQTDNGKLNIEYNMSRIVTRLSSKNFCIIKPSFEIEVITNIETGAPQLRIGTGQASINGMDLIMTSALIIDAPETPGIYYLAFNLARDSSWNVLGDLVYGSTTTFQGVYLTYFDTKDTTNMDRLYLGKVTWDGTQFTEIEEDEDKYGRIWAEDILCKFLDPKHPDIRRLNLQQYIYNIPDWYFSKEGDIVYGPITIADSREGNNPGIIMNVDSEGSHITVKDPTKDNNLLQFYGDVNRDGVIDDKDITLITKYINGEVTFNDLQKILGDVNHDGVIDDKDLQYIQNFIEQNEENYGDTGNIYYIDNSNRGINFDSGNGKDKLEVGQGTIYENESDGILHIHNPKDICIDSEGNINIEGENKITLSTENSSSPVLTLDNDKFSITDPTATDLAFTVQVTNSNTIQQTLGKAIWQYINISGKNYVKLLSSNVDYLDIVPNADFESNLRTRNTIYIGNNSTYGNEKTWLKTEEWLLTNLTNTASTTFKPLNIIINNNTGNDAAGYILVKNNNDTKHSELFDNGHIDLLNSLSGENPAIIFKDGTSSYDVNLYKVYREKKLIIDGSLGTTGNISSNGYVEGIQGLVTGNGIVKFQRGSNDATITKDNNSSALRTNGALYIGSSGTSNLYAGNTNIKGTFTQGSSGQCTIDTSGNINTSGTIRGSKVYNAVYNDYAEVFEKLPSEIIEPGDLVCIKEDGLAYKVSMVGDLDRIVGICSNTEGILLGGLGLEEDQKVIVGMVGKIWTKTNNPYLKPGQLVKALPDGTVDFTNNRNEKFGIVMSNVEDGKVRIVYNG